MSEYQERHTVSKLLGAPPGYVGHGEPTQLLSILAQHPRSVVLVDEIEKAHPDVFLSLMNVMDAGRITPANGPPLDATHAVLVFTTNAVADAGQIVADEVARDAIIRQRLRSAGVPPELVGRLHELLPFRPLGDDHRRAVLRKAVLRTADTFGFGDVTITDRLLDHLTTRQVDAGSGARALEHLVEIELGAALADAARTSMPGPLTLDGPPARCLPPS
jgi:ATP-dependent Clp protease ATP-binding subunit ClpC